MFDKQLTDGRKFLSTCAMALGFFVGIGMLASPSAAQNGSASSNLSNVTASSGNQPPATTRNGQRDFDFEAGVWTTKVRVLSNPLSGQPPNWVAYEGTSIIRPLMGGRANVVELSVTGPSGSIEGVSLRLYEPKSRQWSLNFASIRSGELTPPVIGRFDGQGRGVFYGPDTLGERSIRVRFVITQVSDKEAHFEQAFSADEGKSWEVNWIAVDTRR